MSKGNYILNVEELKTYFFTKIGIAKAVNGVSFSVAPGKILGIVGESGCGKSVTALSILRLIKKPGKIVGGRIIYKDQNLLSLSEEEMRELRGTKISMIFQDALTALNPLLNIETQMVETLKAHKKISFKEAVDVSEAYLSKVGIPSPKERIKAYPFQLSGGMRQRVVIAITLLNNPDIVIADEATTSLDVTIQAQILYEVKKLCKEIETAIIWISHDLSVIAGLVDYVCIMYAGKIVEQGEINEVLDRPLHPYTIGLIKSVPSNATKGKPLYQIRGMVPSLISPPQGCLFYDRCEYADQDCTEEPNEIEPINGHIVRCFHPQMGNLVYA